LYPFVYLLSVSSKDGNAFATVLKKNKTSGYEKDDVEQFDNSFSF
jgi:hypothetical protein